MSVVMQPSLNPEILNSVDTQELYPSFWLFISSNFVILFPSGESQTITWPTSVNPNLFPSSKSYD